MRTTKTDGIQLSGALCIVIPEEPGPHEGISLRRGLLTCMPSLALRPHFTRMLCKISDITGGQRGTLGAASIPAVSVGPLTASAVAGGAEVVEEWDLTCKLQGCECVIGLGTLLLPVVKVFLEGNFWKNP